MASSLPPPTSYPAKPFPPVPVADLAIDRSGRIWQLDRPSLDPYLSLWLCRDTGAGASWAHLSVAYGPVVAVNGHAFSDASEVAA